MNIVFFIQDMSRAGGSERVTSLIANYLVEKAGHSIVILSICGENTSYFNLDNSIKLETLIDAETVDNKKCFVQVVRALSRFYSRNEVDLVIDVFPALSIYTLFLKHKYKYKNISWEHYNYLNNNGMNRIGRKLAVRFSDCIVTLTQTDKSLYLRANRQARKKITYIFNPTPFPNTSGEFKRDRIVLAIGRLELQKGFHHLIHAWSMVESAVNDATLYIIGEGEERSNLLKQIKDNELHHVILTGRINDVENYYKKAMVLVSTSEHEGLPMTMIEAQSFGVPIVSFDYMTGPRDIITNGKDGYIIEGLSQKERNDNMSRKVISILTDKCLQEQLSKEAMKNSRRFAMDRIGKKWMKVISKVTVGD